MSLFGRLGRFDRLGRIAVAVVAVVAGGIAVDTVFFDQVAAAQTCGAGDTECGNGLPPAEAIPSCVVTEFDAEFTITSPDPTVTVPTALAGTYTYPGGGTHDWNMTINSGTVPTGQSSPYHTGRPWGINNSNNPFIVFYGATFDTTMTIDANDGPASIVVPTWSPNADADRWGGTSFRNLFVNSFNNVNVSQAGTYLLDDPSNQTTLASGLYPSGTVFTQTANLTNTKQFNTVTSGTRVLQIDVDGGGAFEGWRYGAKAKYTTCVELEQTGAWVDTNGNGFADVGDHIEYTYTVNNNGSASWTNAELVDNLGGSIGTFSLGQYDTTTLTFNYPLTAADIAAGEVVNSSKVGVTDQFGNNVDDESDDPTDPTNNDTNGDGEPDDVTVVKLPPAPVDLVVTKTDAVDPVANGDTVSYTISVVNNGPGTIDAGDSWFVFDELPVGLTNPTFTPPAGATWDGATGSVTGLTLAPGESADFTVTADVVTSGTTLTNTVTVKPPDDIDDPDTSNNVTTEDTEVLPESDLQISKTAVPSPATAGAPIEWTVTVTNLGPDDATGVELTDVFPAEVTDVSVTGCTFSGDVCPLPDLAAGASHTVTVTGTADPSLPNNSTILNEAKVASASSDPDETNNVTSVQTPVVAEADIVVLKTSSPSPFVPGTPITYTITVQNNGPSTAGGIIVADTFPNGLSGLTTTTPGCTINGSDMECEIPSLDVGSAATIEVQADTDPNLVDPLENTARVISSVTDPNDANNVSTDTNGAAPAADLKVSKVDLQDPVIAGTQVTYTVTVSNGGPSDAVDVELADVISPSSLVLVGSPTISGPSGTCAGTDCSFPLIPAGDTALITYTFEVPGTANDGDVITNSVNVTSTTPDADTSNNAVEETTDITTQADLSIMKSATSADPPVAGQPYTYKLDFANAGPSTITGTTVTDTLPAGTTFVSATPAGACTSSGGEVTCDVAALAAGETGAFEITVQVDPAATGDLTNTATIAAASNASDPNPDNNTDTHGETPATEADLAVSKSVSPSGPVAAGTAIEWTILVGNNGPSVARDVELLDNIPAGVTIDSIDTPGSSVTCAALAPCVLGDLAPGEAITIVVSATINSDVADGTTIDNEASVSSAGGTPDSVPENNSSAVTTEVRSIADVSIIKTVDPNPSTPGAPLTFTITATNAGPSTASGVSFDDVLPPAVSYTGHTVTAGSGTCSLDATTATLSCTSDAMAPGDTFTVEVTADTDPAFFADFDNTAVLGAATAYTDPVTENNTSTVTVGAVPDADLGVSKTPVGAVTVAGTTKLWTIAVTNGGPSVATAAAIVDTLPDDLVFVSATPDIAGASCTHDGATTGGVLTCDLGDVPVGTIVTIEVETEVLSSVAAGATISNSVEVDSTVPDSNPDNDTATATTEVTRSADLSVTKVASSDPVVAGESFEWTITIDNAGPSDAADIQLTDVVPPGISVDAVSPSGCTAQGNDVNCALGALGPDDPPLVVTISATPDPNYVNAGQPNPFINTATASSPDAAGPATASATSLVVARADVQIAKTASASTAVVGDTIAWTIEVTNVGPSTATSVVVNDVIPVGIAVDANSINGTGCTFDGAALSCEVGDLAPNASQTITFEGSIPSSYLADGNPSIVVNEADVTTTTTETDALNNSANATTEVTEVTDLSIAKTSDVATATAGDPVTWTVTVDNAGPADARDVVVADLAPAGYNVSSATANNGGVCDVAVTCNLGVVPVGSPVVITIVGTIDPSFLGASVENTASVATVSPDSDDANNSASAVVEVTTDADLVVSKTGPTSVVPGEPITYQVVVRNDGPSVARNVTLTDSIPSAITDAVFVTPVGSCDVTGQCDLEDLAVGEEVTITINGTVDPAAQGDITNNVSVASGGAEPTPDSNTENNSASTTASAVSEVDVSITKSDLVDPVVAGTDQTWTITVSNAGPSVARDVVVTDVLPAGVTLVSAPGCSGTDTLTCTVADLAPDESATVEVTATVDADYYTVGNPSPMLNTAVVSATGDTDPANNSANETSTVADVAGLAIGKDSAQADAVAGGQLVWTLTVLNSGPSDAQNVTVTDSLPPGTTLVSATSAAGTCTESAGVIGCELGGLAIGATAQIEITVDIDDDYVASGLTNPILNSASTDSDTEDPNPNDNNANDEVPIVDSADLAIEKTGPPTVNAGGEIVWEVTITNNGPSVARNVMLDDPAPTGVTLTNVEPASNCTTAASCTFGDLAPNASATATITGVVDPNWFVTNSASTITNMAIVTSDTTDADETNNQAAVVTEITELAVTSVAKTASPDPVVAGEEITWTVTVANEGPSAARQLVIDDPMPDGVTVTSATTAGGDGCTFAVNCVLPVLEAGATETLTIVATIDSDWSTTVATALSNTATITTVSDPGTPKTAVAEVDVIDRVDLSVAKTDFGATATAGEPVAWQIVVDNAGPSQAVGTTLTDTLPNGLDLDTVAVEVVPASAGSCDVSALPDLTCDLGNLAVDASVTVNVEAVVSSTYLADGNPATMSNTAEVAPDDPATELDNANNTSTDLTPVVTEADLTISKIGPETINAGEQITWQIAVGNIGPSAANNVSITDTIPAGLVIDSADPDCTITDADVDCALAELAVFGTHTITIVATVPDDYVATANPPGITNGAAVTSDTTDPNTGNNNAQVPTTVEELADLSVTKAVMPTTVNAGEAASWSIAVSNAGPSIARNVTLAEQVPEGFTVSSVSADNGANCDAVGNCVLGNLGVNEVVVVTIEGTVDSDVTTTPLTNVATATSDTPDDDGATAQAELVVTTDADLAITKDGPETIVPGEQVTYLITVDNAGPSDALDVVVVDAIPAGLSDVSLAPSQGTCDTTTCEIGSLTAGGQATIEVTATVDPGLIDATMTNSVTVESRDGATPDTNPDNNTAEVTSNLAPTADLAIAKEDIADPVIAGTDVAWQITVTNNGPSVSRGVSIADSLPEGVQLVSADGCTGTADLACDLGDLQPGDSVTVTVTATVDATFYTDGKPSPLTNTASVSSQTADPDDTNDVATEDTTIAALAGVSIGKDADTAAQVAGETVTWTLTVINTGPSAAADVVITDPIPSGLDITSASFAGSDCEVTTEIVCSIGTLDVFESAGDEVTITVESTVSPSYLVDGLGNPLENTASVATATDEDTTDDNQGSDTVVIDGSDDVSITKEAPASVVAGGEGISWTLSVTNAGPSVAENVIVTDVMPNGVTGVATTITPAEAGTCDTSVSCTFATLAPDETVEITIDAVVPAGWFVDGGSATIQNTAQVTSDADSDATNNEATTNTEVTEAAPLTIAKTAAPDPVHAGEEITWTITVENPAGPSVARDVVVTDLIPDGVTVTGAAIDGGSCTFDVECALDALGVQQSATITITGIVDASWFTDGKPETITNTASATSATNPDETVTAEVTSTVDAVFDLAVDKVGPTAPVEAGGTIAWDITVANTGPSDAPVATLADTLPDGLDLDSVVVTPLAPTECDTSALPAVTCDLGVLAAGAATTVRVEATVVSDYLLAERANPIVNTATVTNAGPGVDSNLDNDSSTAATDIVSVADVGITKTADPEPVVAGTEIAWTLTATNIGPSAASGVSVADTIPAGVAVNSVSVEGASTGAETCPTAGQSVVCSFDSMLVGETITITVRGTVDSTFGVDGMTSPIQNAASVSTTSTDSVNDNNQASVASNVVESADLSVTKAADPTEVIAGTASTWVVTVTNNGPSVARSAVLADQLPDGFTLSSASASNGAACDGVGNCLLGDVAVGEVVTVTYDGSVDADVTSAELTNGATVSSETPDPNADNSTTTATVAVTAAADLAVTKSGPATVVPGEQVEYQLEVTNAGPSVAAAVSVTDVLPAGLTLVSAESSVGSCDSAVTCTIGDLAVGSSASVTLTADLDPSTTETEIVNAVTAETTTSDPNPDNNVADVASAVTPLADLQIAKDDDQDLVIAGSELSWTIDVTNVGPSTARSVVVTDELPPGVSLVAAPGCEGTTTLSCDLGDLAPGVGATLSVTVAVDADYYPDGLVSPMSNQATVSSVTEEVNPADNASSDTTTIGAQAGLSIAKDADIASIRAGEQITWTITAYNAGPSAAENVVVGDPLPAGVAVDGVQASNGGTCSDDGGMVACELGTLAVDETVTITVSATVNSAYVADGLGQPLSNAATIGSETEDPFPQDNTGIDLISVTDAADLVINKTGSSSADAGGEINWSIEVSNPTGPSVARSVSVSDFAPAGVTVTAATTSLGGGLCDLLVTCNLGDLAVGDSVTINLTGTVDSTWFADGRTDTIINTAEATAATTDPDPDNNTDTAATTIGEVADLTITKAATPEPVVAGQGIEWVVEVSNAGPSAARLAQIVDPLPIGTSITSVSTTGGGVCSFDVDCTYDLIDAGDSVTVTIGADVAADWLSSSRGALVNSATATTETNPGESVVAVSETTVTAEVDVSVAKTARAPALVSAGERATFQITVANDGPSDATEVAVTDTLPDGLGDIIVTAPTGVDCDVTGLPDLACTAELISVGESVSITVSGLVAPSYFSDGLTTPMVNQASVSAADDTTPDNNETAATIQIANDAGVSIGKSASPTPVIAGETITWSIVVANAGPGFATAVAVSDAIPAGVTVGESDVLPGVGTCSVTTSIECQLGDLPPGAEVPILVSGIVGNNYVADPINADLVLPNTATVATTSTDEFTDDNTATVTTPVDDRSDLRIAKTVVAADAAEPDAPATAGLPVEWTITVDNFGPSVARSVQITDAIPDGVSIVSVTPSDPALTCSIDESIVCELGQLAPTSDPAAPQLTLSVVGTVAADYVSQGMAQPLTNTASVTTESNDPSPATATAAIEVVDSADIVVAKSADAEGAVAGGELSWTIDVANNGPSDARSVVVSDTLVDGLELVSVVASDGSACSAEIACELGTMPPGTSVQIDLVTRISPELAAGGVTEITNTATASSLTPDPQQTIDPIVTVPIGTSADLAVTKTDVADPVVAGTASTWTIGVTNNGPSVARDVAVVDVLPTGVAPVSIVAADGSTCSIVDGCTFGEVAVGEQRTVTVVGLIDENYLSSGNPNPAINTATVASAEPDPDDSNNATDEDTTIGAQAGLSISKVASADQVIAGETISWALTIRNAGPSLATDVVVEDMIPAGISVESVDTVGTTECDTTVSCAVDDLGSGEVTVITINGTVDPAAALNGPLEVVNEATVSTSAEDPTDSDNVANATTTVDASADLSLIKTAGADVGAGGVLTWTLTVSNTGPSAAKNVVVTDTVPDGLTVTSVVADNDAACTNAVRCKLGTMAPGDVVVITVETATPVEATSRAFLNSAEVTSPTPDPNLDNNGGNATGTALGAQIGLALSVSEPVMKPDGTFELRYQFTVVNSGSTPLAGVQITDDLAAVFAEALRWKVVSLSSDDLTVNDAFDGIDLLELLTGTDVLAPGQVALLDLVVEVTPSESGQEFANTATVSASPASGVVVEDVSTNGSVTDPDGDGDPGDNSEPTVSKLSWTAQIEAAKQVDGSVTSNGNGTFQVVFDIDVRNSGDVNLSDVQITDDLSESFGAASGFTVASVTSPDLSANADFDGVDDIKLLAGTDQLGVGDGGTVQLNVTVRPASSGQTFTNQAIAFGDDPGGTVTQGASSDGSFGCNGGNDCDDDAKPSGGGKTPIKIPDTGARVIRVLGGATGLVAAGGLLVFGARRRRRRRTAPA